MISKIQHDMTFKEIEYELHQSEVRVAEKVSFVPSTNLTSTAFSNGTRLLSSDAGLPDLCAVAMINRVKLQ